MPKSTKSKNKSRGRGAPRRGRASSRRGGKRRKERSRLRRALLPAFILALAGTLCLSAAAIYYYGKFNRLLEARLKAGRPLRTQVYSRPEVLVLGQKISRDAVVDRLLDLAYKTRDGAPGPFFTVSEQEIRIRHKNGQEKVLLSFDSAGIHQILVNDRPVAAVELEPQFLTSLFGQEREQQRKLSFDEIPDKLLKAVLAAEDSRFFEHPGIDLPGIARAAFVDLIHWERRQGGSTLTQQFVKNYFLTPEKEIPRKVEEIVFSLLLEKRMSKQQIFELYANEVYLGQVGTFAIIGFGQAARVYFGKPINQLSLAEAATLAAIIPAPNRYSPYRNSAEVLERRNWVLSRMEQLGFISTRQMAEAKTAQLGVLPPSRQNFAVAPYFVDYVSSHAMPSERPPAREELVIHTTLDPYLQKVAYESVEEGIERVRKRVAKRNPPPDPQAALIAVDPRTGEILAMVGGQDYARVQFNHATNGRRQPGSAFKPFVYAAIFEESRKSSKLEPVTLATQVLDEPYSLDFGGRAYRPHNYHDQYYGMVSVREALAKSLNVPTVKLAQRIGWDAVRKYALDFGFDSSIKAYPSVALGAFEVSLLELVQGYQALANGGLQIPLNAIRSLETDGRKQVVEASPGKRVIPREIAFLVTSALESTLDAGTARSARSQGFRLPAAGKTGSTEDSWFVGFTPELLCGVWVGSDSEVPLDLSGAAAALPIWTSFMKRAQQMDYLSGRAPTG